MDGTALIERSFSRLDRRTSDQDIQAMVLIVTDNGALARSLEMVCDFLGLAVETVRGAKPWAAAHYFLAPIRRDRVYTSCAISTARFRAKPSRA